jgi:hypothetical protein
MIPNLHRLHDALTAALPLAGARQLADGPTTAELALEARFTAALQPALDDLYRYPLRGGIDSIPTISEAALAAWLLDRYDDATATAVLRFVLNQNTRRGVNIGGQIALEQLGLPGAFDLQDEAYLDLVSDYAAGLTAVDADISLTRTTANELARAIAQGRLDGLTGAALSAYVGAYIIGRVPGRSAVIAATETVTSTRAGLGWTYANNGVAYQILRNHAGACPLCQAENGERFTIAGGFVVGPIPLHTGCRCFYEPDMSAWTAPEEVWTGG